MSSRKLRNLKVAATKSLNLESIGFQFIRQSGSSHAIYKRAGDKRRTNVQIHSGKIIKRKTLKAILKDADLTVDQFRNFKDK